MKRYVRHIIQLFAVLALFFPVGKGYAQTTADQQVPQGQSRTYQVTTTPGYQYHWSVSSGGTTTDLASVTGGAATIKWDGTPGIYTLKLSVTQEHLSTDGYSIATCVGDPKQITVEILAPYTFELVADHNIMPVSDGSTAFNGSVFTNDFKLLKGSTTTKSLPLSNLSNQTNLNVSIKVAPQHGNVVIGRKDGHYSYIPDKGYQGPDSFTYQVEMNGITTESSVQFKILGTDPAREYPPVAFNDVVRAPVGTAKIRSTVLNNDIDQNGDALSVDPTPLKAPKYGTVELHADGTYIYTPSTSAPQADQFTYVVSDGTSTDTARVDIDLYDNTDQDNPPFGGDDLFMCFMKPVSGSVATNDLPVDNAHPVTYSQVTDVNSMPKHGNITSWNSSTGEFTYTPQAGYIGADNFVYELNDGTHQTYATAYLYVMPDMVVDAGNDTTVSSCAKIVADASGSSGLNLKYHWSSTNGTFEDTTAEVTNYTADGPGVHQLILKATNGSGLTATDTCVVTVLPAPNIVMDAPNTIQSGSSAILDASASTGEGTLTYHWETTDGTIEGAKDQPTLEISSAGTYTLTITDQYGCMSSQDVFVQAVEHAPVAYDDFAQTSSQEPVNIAVLTNDIDIDNDLDTSSVTIILQPSYGDVSVLPDGTINYTPTLSYQGNDQFTYQVCDTADLCDTAVVVVDVSKGPFVIPEAFSPNRDGFNDTFEIPGIEQYPGTNLTVYNRWQNKVYESKDYKNDWDGRCNTGLMSGDRLLPVGTYYYVLILGGTHKTYKGFVYIAY